MDTIKKKPETLTKRQKKQKFREQRYKKALGSKKEGHGFAEFKKKKAVHEYNKLLRKEERIEKHKALKKQPEDGASAITTQNEPLPEGQRKRPKKLHTVQKTKIKLKEIAQEKEQAKKEKVVKEAAKSKAIAKYHEKKQERYKMMCKKNFRGQPKVAGQMELLLQKIEASRKT